MNRREFTQIIGITLASTPLYGMGSKRQTSKNALSGSRPNIILIMTDDQGYGDVGCHGHPFLKTPNTDKLYTQSTRFTDFHASPTCAPTRSALMSGRAPFKNGITHTILERDRMTLKATTIAQVLKSAGYTTGVFGKWHLGDGDEYQPHNRGFDETFIHGAGGIGQNFPGTQGDAPGTGYFNPVLKHNNSFVKTKGYCTDLFFHQALGWIKEQTRSASSGQAKPFFAYIPTNAPHSPFKAPKKYSDMYMDKVKGNKGKANFFGMITNIDDNMGILMQKLDEWKLADNTLLIFMTDNGSANGTFNYNMKGTKGSPDEGGSRVPLFMRLPNKIKQAVDVDRLARHYDIFPTLAEFSGARIPKDLDGRSLVPLINDPKCEWADRYTFFHVGRWPKKGAKGHWGRGNCDPESAKYRNFAIRNQKWRLVGKGSLYDIENDPSQKKNVIKDNPEVASKMMDAYEKWWAEVRPLMVNEDAPLNVGKPFVEQFNKQKKEGGIPDWKPPVL